MFRLRSRFKTSTEDIDATPRILAPCGERFVLSFVLPVELPAVLESGFTVAATKSQHEERIYAEICDRARDSERR
jgi:hypothetical protein